MKNPEKLKELYGDVVTLTTPSSHTITIREQTGEDDDILSNAKGVLDGSSTNKFIAGLIVDTDITPSGLFSIDDAKNLRLADKWFIMISSRIFSLGQILKFTYKWVDGLEVEYEEDLGLYIWDYSDEAEAFPQKGDPNYFSQRIPPSKLGKQKERELSLKSVKVIKYNFMDGHAEKWLMSLSEEQQSINVELLARKVQLKMDSGFVKVENFKTFSPRDMMEIRKDVEEYDRAISLITELIHPNTGDKVDYPLIASTDFFFPREV